MSHHSFDNRNRYIIQDYTNLPPFSSFLPGIAGPMGIPMWVFYTNRGQAITSFGVESKDHPMMEFLPANKAYRHTPLNGFRTFIKQYTNEGRSFYEPFSAWTHGRNHKRTMLIGMNELEIIEDSASEGLRVNVLYFTLPGESFAGLVRQVTITNTDTLHKTLEILDGAPAIIPYGVNNSALKEINRTIEAWMEVSGHENGLPFFQLRASSADSAQVSEIQSAHFALSSLSDSDNNMEMIRYALVDPRVLFGQNTSFSTPDVFLESNLEELFEHPQITCGMTPCAFFGTKHSLEPHASITLSSIYGTVSRAENIQHRFEQITTTGYLREKREEASQMAISLTDVVETNTSLPLFDAYTRQTFLDNILHGGWPVLLGDQENPHVYHIYSRKHGDPERDYNHFFLAAEYYSQGNGNNRDVNQNRRCDVLLEPRVADHNIRVFLSLIQPDGYNPLVVHGTTFTITPEHQVRLVRYTDSTEELLPLIQGKFTPGGLLKAVEGHHIQLNIPLDEFINKALTGAEQHIEATHGEGFWVDHWTYILDLIETFLTVYPEQKGKLLFHQANLPYFESFAAVQPREHKHILTPNGIRQYDAVLEDEEHEAKIKGREENGSWIRTAHGAGEIYYSTTFVKLLLLVVTKFGLLDPYGMGVEMEAGKPGWYDALNGMPGLLGSSMPESYELLRLIRYLRAAITEEGDFHNVNHPAELHEYLLGLSSLAEETLSGQKTFDADSCFQQWDVRGNLRENYRASVRYGFIGEEQRISFSELDRILARFEKVIEIGINRAMEIGENLPPTYFRWEVVSHEPIIGEDGLSKTDPSGQPYVKALALQPTPLPPFLEGPVRAYKVLTDIESARELHIAVTASPLFDRKLKMFKVNASLMGETHEIGRARAFTPGWLENESIWLHMSYKYLLELLKSGLCSEFWDAARHGMPPFMDPLIYGRSPLENSSFLASSAHPDSSLHGRGFVARLSGSTAEFLHMWTIMMAGTNPFTLKDGSLQLQFKPALPNWLFPDNGQVSFTFLGSIHVTYYNPHKANTWELKPIRITLVTETEEIHLQGSIIPSPYAEEIRGKTGIKIHVYF